MIFLVFVFLFELCVSNESLLYRWHGKGYYVFDECTKVKSGGEASSFLMVSKKGSKISISYNCEDSGCSNCKDHFETEFKKNKFVGFPGNVFLNSNVFQNTRFIKERKSPRNLHSGDIGAVVFKDQQSCQEKDFSKAVLVGYNGGNLKKVTKGGCYAVSNSLYSKCECSKKFLKCSTYGDKDCKYESFPITPCDENSPFYPSLPMQFMCDSHDLSKIGKGIEFDTSLDWYVETSERVFTVPNTNYTMSLPIKVTKKDFTNEQCSPPGQDCKKLFVQPYTQRFNRDVRSKWYLSSSVSISQLFAYGTKRLEIEKGKKNDEGFYDIIETGGTKYEPYLNPPNVKKTAEIYYFSSSAFEVCQQGIKLECLENGTVLMYSYNTSLVNTLGCSKVNMLTVSIRGGMVCGKLPHTNWDLSVDLFVTVLIIVGVVVGSILLILLICCCCCCVCVCILCCVFIVFVSGSGTVFGSGVLRKSNNEHSEYNPMN